MARLADRKEMQALKPYSQQFDDTAAEIDGQDDRQRYRGEVDRYARTGKGAHNLLETNRRIARKQSRKPGNVGYEGEDNTKPEHRPKRQAPILPEGVDLNAETSEGLQPVMDYWRSVQEWEQQGRQGKVPKFDQRAFRERLVESPLTDEERKLLDQQGFYPGENIKNLDRPIRPEPLKGSMHRLFSNLDLDKAQKDELRAQAASTKLKVQPTFDDLTGMADKDITADMDEDELEALAQAMAKYRYRKTRQLPRVL